MNKKIIISAVSVILALTCVVGVTLAWLTDKTNEVVNTFTYGDINIDLSETTTDYKMVPGSPITKDPKVTVKAGSEACWLFVEIVESENFDDFMTYAIAAGWTFYDTELAGGKIDTVTNDNYVIYRKVDSMVDATTDETYTVLKDDRVTVNTNVTKEMMEAIKKSDMPTLTFTAYAVQSANVATVADAWSIAKPQTPTT